MFEKLVIKSQGFYELMVSPNFTDIVPDGDFNGTLGEFSVMDNVSSELRIIDILGNSNIMKRRDATCNLVFTPVGTASTRLIKTTKIYGATLQCDNEFYQGCLEDFRSQNKRFRDYIVKFFLNAMKNDLSSNAYFGDITRANDANGIWNWNSFDGIFKKYAAWITAGTIPAAQTFSIATGALSAATAYGYIVSAYNKQTVLMRSLAPNAKAFYVSQGIFDGYEDYLISTGGAFNINYYKNGIPQLSYKGIPVLLEPTWTPILTALNAGTEDNALILTVRGNFLFATDKTYGEGPNLNEALRIWYSEDDLVWKYAMFMKAGTEIALPQHTIFAN